ncbi:response regulator transcription factor [Pseudothauera rhizosphaerae]|uniref:Response regulator transcription factor n=1 Tax=Pseudothauera rhizosphaerae TaxID=2565932 RepID=A0A4S4AUY8_9RHOO|nr:response regulator [Pseudothauera rhizosphaerae]THF63350.1 response regulator transcription factor [Pseudothauera rhizosphaerae]
MTDRSPQTIHIVDDDAAFRRSLVFLLESVGWQAVAHASAEDFLASCGDDCAGLACLVLDIRMPMMSGLELQQRLAQRGWTVPVVFITGHGDVELAVQAMKHGASDFLEKPFRDQALIDAVTAAVRKGNSERADAARREEAAAVLARLSPRESEVARLVALGLPNKVVARELDISEKTVHVHRQHVMDKTGLGSAAELARLMLRADPHALD